MYYQYNNLNQLAHKTVCDLTSYVENSHEYRYTYDKRGNLVLEENCERTTQGNKWITEAIYEYNAANRLAIGTNTSGEKSIYTFNGLGQLVQNTWIVENNAYGYHDMNGQTDVSSDLKKPEVVVKDFVIDATSPVQAPLTEDEQGGLTYRYTYGLERVSVQIGNVTTSAGGLVTDGDTVKLYYHTDRLGTYRYLTDDVKGKVTSWTDYDEWGNITHNAVLKMGKRQLDLVKNYTGHEYDNVLAKYYAKARMYDPQDKRFTQIDPLREGVNHYVYCFDNPIKWIDPLGLASYIPFYINGKKYDDMAFNENGKTYISTKYAYQFGVDSGVGGTAAEVIGSHTVQGTHGPYTVYDTRQIYKVNNTTIYYQTFGCFEGYELGSIAKAGDMQDVLSWWRENNQTSVVFNTAMKNAPVQVIRQGDQINITINAWFAGDAFATFDNVNDAQALFGEELDSYADYYRQITYKDAFINGVVGEWSGSYTKNEYDSFGDYDKVYVSVNFKSADKELPGYMKVYIDTSTPTDLNIKEVSNTHGTWVLGSKSSKVAMYDHYWGFSPKDKKHIHEEYSIYRFQKTAAHEFGHVFGLGDAYETSWHSAPPITTEIPQVDMMRTNGEVRANDIEMILQAWKTNQRQEYIASENYPQSDMIRYK